MKVYKGYRDNNGTAHVDVLDLIETGVITSSLNHVVRHSPTGFEWGYHGSGPSELARCILLDMGYPEQKVDMVYQEFKRWRIAEYDQQQGWELHADSIKIWWEAKHYGLGNDAV